MRLLAIVRALLFATSALGADRANELFRSVQYLGEIGHLGTAVDTRTSVDFGSARVTLTEGESEFSGKDDAGQEWTARFPVIGGVGWTTVWKADFDANGRTDLMIASFFPKNGRCTDGVTVLFLMIDSRGRPNPWEIQTQMPKGAGLSSIPAILTSLTGDHRAELVATNCEYGDTSGEDRSVTGFYEAKNSAWRLRRVGAATYARITSIVLQSYAFRKGIDRLKRAQIARWQNLGNFNKVPTDSGVQLTEVLPAEAGCEDALRFGPVVDGKVARSDENNPCGEGGKDRIRLSTGTTCYGWPTVVLDRRNSREIATASSRLVPSILRDIRDRHLTIDLTGELTQGRCQWLHAGY